MPIQQIQFREAIPGSGLLVFECPSLRASLSKQSCADNFVGRRCFPCQQCEVGARHAGKAPNVRHIERFGASSRCGGISLATALGAPCVRCGGTGKRLLAGAFCVNCYNRQRECLAGRNSKGKFPTVTGAALRWISSLVLSEGDLTRAFYPSGCSSLSRSDFGGLPKCEPIDSGAWLVRCVATDADEFARAMTRVAPGAEVVDVEEGRSFLEMTAKRF